MHELFRKYLDNQCSPTDIHALLAYFNNPVNELLLRKLIVESLENQETDDEGSQFQEATDKLFGQIKKEINTEKVKTVPLLRKTWFRIAATVLLLAGSITAYNYYHQNTASPVIATTDTVANEINPGGNRAMVTLADGTTINLEKALNDTLAQQGITSLVKLTDGQLSYKAKKEKPAGNLYNKVATPRGGQYQVILSDGTHAWLNAASSIRFPVAFTGKERVIELSGEAYFEVAKNASMPFKVILANKAEVEVLGTHFNINAYSDEATINTTLLEGSVKVTGLMNEKSRVLVPGEQAKLGANGQMEINKANVEESISWKNGIFNFNHADLDMSLRQIARWYDVDIVYEGPIPQKKFQGEMQRTLTLPQVIKLLEKSSVYCRIEGKKLIVKD